MNHQPRLSAEVLEDRSVPAVFADATLPVLWQDAVISPPLPVTVVGVPVVVVGSQSGGAAKTFRGGESAELHPFGDFAGGVSVAAADVNGDGVTDVVTGAGAGGSPRVVVLDGRTGAELRSFLAFGADFTGGVNVSTGDVNFDGYGDVVAAVAGGGAPHVKVFDGKTGAELRSFFAYDPAYTGGVRAAAADLNRDGHDDIVTAPAGTGGPNVRVFSGTDGSLLRSFNAYAGSYTGGVSVAAADVDRDGYADIVTGSAVGSSHVKVFSGRTGAEVDSFFAFAPEMPGGVSVATGLFNADLGADIAVAGSGAAPEVRVLDGQSGAELSGIAPGELGFAGGVNVGVGAALVTVTIPPGPSIPDTPAR